MNLRSELPPLRVSRADALLRSPRPEPLIDRFLVRKGVAVIAAPPYSGKTFLALEAMRAVVEAKAGFLGHFGVPRPGNVLYLGNDSPAWDIASQFDKLIGLPDPKTHDVGRLLEETDLGSYGFIFEPGFMLNTAEDAERVIDAARRQSSVRDFTRLLGDEERYRAVRGTDLIVIDTLRSVHGFEENDNTGMQHVMNLLRYIANETSSSVLALHHFNKGSKESPQASLERLRGATAIGGAVDSVFALTGKWPSIAVRVLKHRPFPRQKDFVYRIEESEDEVRLLLEGDGVMSTGARNGIIRVLRAGKGGWVKRGDINAAVAAELEEKADSKKVAGIVDRALKALEESGVVARVHGAARLLDTEVK